MKNPITIEQHEMAQRAAADADAAVRAARAAGVGCPFYDCARNEMVCATCGARWERGADCPMCPLP